MSSKELMEEKILKELKEQTKWLRFLALPDISKIVNDNIKTKEQKYVYDFSDGINSTYDIEKKLFKKRIKISHMTVHNYWKKWFALGLVELGEKYSGRYRKITSLSDLNIKY